MLRAAINSLPTKQELHPITVITVIIHKLSFAKNQLDARKFTK